MTGTVVGEREERAVPRIVLVCTANMCRSPLAAALLTRALDERRLSVSVASAGLLPGGHRVPADGISIARELSLDLSGHVSSQLDLATATDADLILTMTREQARTIVAEAPVVFATTFALADFGDWLRRVEAPTGAGADACLHAWLAEVDRRRPRSELLGVGPGDVPDPMGEGPAVWRRVAALLIDELDAAADGLARLLVTEPA